MAYWRVFAAIFGGFLSLAGGTGWAADLVTFRLNDSQGPEAPGVQALFRFSEILREKSGGRISIDVRPRSRDSVSFTIGQLRNGSLEMARIDLAALGGYAPTAEVLSMPYLVPSRSEMRSLVAGPIGDRVRWELENAGLIGLCFYDMTARSFYGNRPIRTARDAAGLTIQVAGSELSSEIVRVLGATPLPLPLWQVRDALATGAADVSEGNWITYISTRHYEVAPYFSQTEHALPPNMLVLSRSAWNRLSQSDRRLISEAARDSVEFQRERLRLFEQDARRIAEAAGAKIVEDVDRRSFAEALAPLRQKLLTERRQLDLLNNIRTPGIAVAPEENTEGSLPLPK